MKCYLPQMRYLLLSLPLYDTFGWGLLVCMFSHSWTKGKKGFLNQWKIEFFHSSMHSENQVQKRDKFGAPFQ